MFPTSRKRRSGHSISTTDSISSDEMPSPPKILTLALTLSRIKNLLLLLSFSAIIYLVFHKPLIYHQLASIPRAVSLYPTRRHHILFSIASSSISLPRRKPYINLWYSPNSTRALAFLDRSVAVDSSLPPVIMSGDTSRFPYKFPRGLRSAIRLARIVKEAVDRREPDVRWFVFGDDDTVFVVDNIVRVLSKYDHDQWYYIGSNSESYEQNVKYSFDMAFGGGGFAISASLARVLAGVLDSCLMRYSHLYGSDSRVFSCLAELGVELTHEPGFHQIDVRGDLFGMLCAHPLAPLVSLHHLEALEPIFPNTSRIEALGRLFKAANADPARILQQSVCYDRSNSLTISVAWGYAVQIYDGNKLLPDLLAAEKSFLPWKRGAKVQSSYMFNTRDHPRDQCRRPAVFFLESVVPEEDGLWSNYVRHDFGNCVKANATKNLEQIRVFTHTLELEIEKAPRRQCCDISHLHNNSMVINIKKCREDELISMHS